MSYREQRTVCPRCRTLIEISAVLVDERAMVRVLGRCVNPFCIADEVARDVDPLQVAAAASSLKRAAKPQRVTAPLAGCGH
jgi:hypothetical protein